MTIDIDALRKEAAEGLADGHLMLISPRQMFALLDRLEAAERVCENYGKWNWPSDRPASAEAWLCRGLGPAGPVRGTAAGLQRQHRSEGVARAGAGAG